MTTETETLPAIDVSGVTDATTRLVLEEMLERGYTIAAPHLTECRSAGADWREWTLAGALEPRELTLETLEPTDGRPRTLRIIDGTTAPALELRCPFWASDLAALLEAALRRRRELRPIVTIYRREWTQDDLEAGDFSGDSEDVETEEHELEPDFELEETLETVAADLLEDAGATEPSSAPGPIGAGDWFAGAELTVSDYRTGNLEECSGHISGGLSPESVRLELERRNLARRDRGASIAELERRRREEFRARARAAGAEDAARRRQEHGWKAGR